jgi:hypothetical protein
MWRFSLCGFMQERSVIIHGGYSQGYCKCLNHSKEAFLASLMVIVVRKIHLSLPKILIFFFVDVMLHIEDET